MRQKSYLTARSSSRGARRRCVLVERDESIESPQEIPTFDVTRSRDGVCLSFTCPRCGWRNTHAAVGPKKGDGDGHRGSHCRCWPRGYELREVTESAR